MENLPDVIDVQSSPIKKIGTGAKAVKMKKLAELMARGWNVPQIAKELQLSTQHVYRLLNRPEVCSEVNEIVSEKFKDGDRLLSFLYKKAMIKLDEDMESSIPEIRQEAIEKVLKCVGYPKSKDGLTINQQINTGGGNVGLIQDIDSIILQKRKERGLK